MPQLIHLQWFYELAEKPPGSSEAYVTYTGKDTALLQRLLHCLNTRLCVKYLHCSVLPATTRRRVPRATTSVTDAISQYSGADKRGFCIWPAFLFPVLKYKRPKLLLPTPLRSVRGEEQEQMKSIYQISQICTTDGQHMEDLISQTPAPKAKRF